jgi:hypothetical protein
LIVPSKILENELVITVDPIPSPTSEMALVTTRLSDPQLEIPVGTITVSPGVALAIAARISAKEELAALWTSEEVGFISMLRVTLSDPEPLLTFRVTPYEPAVANVCVGFLTVLVAPSSKFHCQEVGFPAEVSVK